MIAHAMIYIVAQFGNSYAILSSNHESGHDLETEEKSGLKYFWLNTITAQGKKVQVFPSFQKEWLSQ